MTNQLELQLNITKLDIVCGTYPGIFGTSVFQQGFQNKNVTRKY